MKKLTWMVFSNWVSLATNTPASNSFTFLDTNAVGFPIRFYRVIG
jgi:hypothetical protein